MKAGVRSGTWKDQANCIILQSRFNDVDWLTEQLQGFGKLQLTQLSTDRLFCDIWAVVFEEVQVIFSESSCPLLCIGEKYRHYVGISCILDAQVPEMISHNRRVSEHTLWGFAPNWDTRMIVPAKLQLVSIMIQKEVFQNYLEVMDRPDIGLGEQFWDCNYVVAPYTLPSVRAYLSQLSNLILHQPAVLRQPPFKRLILEDFIPLLINAIPAPHQSLLQPPAPLKRSHLVQQAEEYMMAHIHEPLTLKDLCKALYSSRSPLFTAFQEVFGVGPMEYLKAQRLHCVRRILKAADPGTDSVTAIARNYGFWSAGHFTRDYKQMFGELPSETLKRG